MASDKDLKILNYLKTIPAKDRDKKIAELMDNSLQKDIDTKDVDRSTLDKLMCVEAFVISAIAAKNGIPIERMMYDLATSYYSPDKNLSDKDFKYPSDIASSDNIDENKESDYYRNMPAEILIDEGNDNEFRDKLLEFFK